MAYSSIQNLLKWIPEATLIQLCTDSAEAQISDEEVTGPVDESIESADSIIDSYMLARWSGLRAITTPPPIVNFSSCVLAVSLLYLRRGKLPLKWQVLYDERMSWLDRVNRGELVLPETSTGTLTGEAVAKFQTDALEMTDDDNLADLDARNFTAGKLNLLTGVPYRDES